MIKSIAGQIGLSIYDEMTEIGFKLSDAAAIGAGVRTELERSERVPTLFACRTVDTFGAVHVTVQQCPVPGTVPLLKLDVQKHVDRAKQAAEAPNTG